MIQRSRSPLPRRHRQEGIALITAVFVITLAVIIATSLVTTQSIAISRTGNLLQREQALWYSTGVENWAAQILVQDREDGEVDSLDEIWAFPVDYLPIDGGFVSGQLTDQHGRFNLNDLAVQSAGEAEQAAEQLQKLIELVIEPEPVPVTFNSDGEAEPVEEQERIEDVDPIALTQVIADWIDADIDPRIPSGAEDDFYLGLEIPYRTANQPMASVSELRLVSGMTPKLFKALAPLVATLPVGTQVNVNTADVKVLAAMIPQMTVQEAAELVSSREDEPFESVEDFMQHDAMAGREVDDTRFTVSSEFFLLSSQATVGKSSVTQYSLLHRASGGTVSVIGHSYHEF